MTAKTAAVVSFRQYAGAPNALADLLTQGSVLREGHFQLLSGLHTDRFLSFSGIAHHPDQLDLVASWLQPSVESWSPSAILSPSTAGVALAAALARNLSIRLFMATQDEVGRPTSIVGSAFSSDERVLLVNDVTTTGASVNALARLVEEAGASVAGAAWFASRNPNALAVAPFRTARVADLDLPSWPVSQCPRCVGGEDAAELAIDLN